MPLGATNLPSVQKKGKTRWVLGGPAAPDPPTSRQLARLVLVFNLRFRDEPLFFPPSNYLLAATVRLTAIARAFRLFRIHRSPGFGVPPTNGRFRGFGIGDGEFPSVSHLYLHLTSTRSTCASTSSTCSPLNPSTSLLIYGGILLRITDPLPQRGFFPVHTKFPRRDS